MKTYAITEQNLNALLNYLASQPYREVAGFINGLQSLNEVQEKEESED